MKESNEKKLMRGNAKLTYYKEINAVKTDDVELSKGQVIDYIRKLEFLPFLPINGEEVKMRGEDQKAVYLINTLFAYLNMPHVDSIGLSLRKNVSRQDLQ